jgi:hypothetical protein
MDAHYDQVMNARAKAADSGTRPYFAWSTILDREAFLEWRDQHGYDFFELPAGELAEAQGLSLVYDFPSRWWAGRVAGLQDAQGASVWGRLYEVPVKDWPVVQHKEGAVTGMAVERAVRVKVDGREVEATAFTTNPARASLDGPVSARFVQALVRGATSAGLPGEWIASLPGSAK